MTVLFGTLGWRPQSLMPSIKSTDGLDLVVFYHSAHAKSRTARSRVVEFCSTLGVPVTAVELGDAFDLLEIAARIRQDVLKARREGLGPVRFNIAGGTRLMSSAALLVCVLEGVPATYVHDETFKEIQLPMIHMSYANRLSERQREILAFLVAHRDRPPSETTLAKALGVHKSTMNHHVKELVAKGVVEVAADPKDTRAHLVRAAPGAELLVG
jgi:putative CRISPR-associated protein (TIGR02619 family)